MSKQKVVLLIDGDPIAYMAASRAEVVHVFDDIYINQANMSEALAYAKSYIQSLVDQLKASHVVVALSPSNRAYWRHDVMPEYKGSRKGIKSPLCLKDLKDKIAQEYESERWDYMEADDVLGILATDSNYMTDHKKIVVSIDKDMKTLPDTWIYNPDQDYQPWLNTREEADRFFLMQAIGGDSTDGYPGVIGMSVNSAASFLDAPWLWESYEHTFKSGARKGLTETRWRKAESSGDLWTDIVSLFVKAGQTEKDARDNARVARICRVSDYDADTSEVLLWQPEMLND